MSKVALTVDVRSTPQRRAVLDVIDRATDHPTAAEVLERVNEVLPGVGAATVYRALGRLVDAGQIAEFCFGSSATRYDRNVDHHEHLICDRCGRVEDVVLDLHNSQLLAPLTKRGDFAVTSYDLRVHGVCHDCTITTTENHPHPKEK
ncbi:MAG TPA: transcriptional repressor [Mycobacteriales bacterium]